MFLLRALNLLIKNFYISEFYTFIKFFLTQLFLSWVRMSEIFYKKNVSFPNNNAGNIRVLFFSAPKLIRQIVKCIEDAIIYVEDNSSIPSAKTNEGTLLGYMSFAFWFWCSDNSTMKVVSGRFLPYEKSEPENVPTFTQSAQHTTLPSYLRCPYILTHLVNHSCKLSKKRLTNLNGLYLEKPMPIFKIFQEYFALKTRQNARKIPLEELPATRVSFQENFLQEPFLPGNFLPRTNPLWEKSHTNILPTENSSLIFLTNPRNFFGNIPLPSKRWKKVHCLKFLNTFNPGFYRLLRQCGTQVPHAPCVSQSN